MGAVKERRFGKVFLAGDFLRCYPEANKKFCEEIIIVDWEGHPDYPINTLLYTCISKWFEPLAKHERPPIYDIIMKETAGRVRIKEMVRRRENAGKD